MAQYRIGLLGRRPVVVMTKQERELARTAFGIDDAVVIPYFGEVPPPLTVSRERRFSGSAALST